VPYFEETIQVSPAGVRQARVVDERKARRTSQEVLDLACISGRSFKTGAIVESEWSVF